MAPRVVKLTFRITYITQWGQQLWLERLSHQTTAGASAMDGGRTKMKWTTDHVWECSGTVAPGTPLVYRYMVTADGANGEPAQVLRTETTTHQVRFRVTTRVSEAKVDDAWDIHEAFVSDTAMCLALAIHPKFGSQSPASLLLNEWMCRDIVDLVLDGEESTLRKGLTPTVVFNETIHKHPLTLVDPRKNTGWRCDIKDCAGGYVRFSMTRDVDRYTCRPCDFDLCLPCFKKQFGPHY